MGGCSNSGGQRPETHLSAVDSHLQDVLVLCQSDNGDQFLCHRTKSDSYELPRTSSWLGEYLDKKTSQGKLQIMKLSRDIFVSPTLGM